MQPGAPVVIVRNGHVVTRGFFYGQTSPTQIAVRCADDPSRIGLFNAADVERARADNLENHADQTVP